MPKFTLYAVITQDGCDQICETKATANAEIFDLRAMGHKVKSKSITGTGLTEREAINAAWGKVYAKYPDA